MPNPNRQKGDRLERSLVKQLKKAGFEAKRVPLSGSVSGFPGDVITTIANQQLTIEAKVRQNGFKQLYQWLESSDILVVKADRQSPLVVMPLEDFLALAKQANIIQMSSCEQNDK